MHARILPVTGLLFAAAGLCGCSIPFGRTTSAAGSPQPSTEAVAACNSRADEVFLRQNRDALYRADTYQSSIRDSPYAGAGPPGNTQALSQQYGRAQDVRTCLNGVATPVQTQPTATAAP